MKFILLFVFSLCTIPSVAQITLLMPEGVFDGTDYHENWVVAIAESTIVYAGPEKNMPRPASPMERVDLKGHTLMPGLIEGHGHLLLYPYNERTWNDQVLKESPELRAIRGAKMAEITLQRGITTYRDLGSEGAGYADLALSRAINEGIIQGPELLVAGPAIVATGSYGPKGFHPGVTVPLGAQEADGIEGVTRVVREQIGRGVNFVKVYADYRWGPNGTARPTFTIEELTTMVEVAGSSGRVVVAHAATEEGMRRAIAAGVSTIEHGDMGTLEIFEAMKTNGIAFCPTLAAVEAITDYFDQDDSRINAKKASFSQALQSGVSIIFGGDVGVFPHGNNVWELELMVEYGMSEQQALRAATSGNALIFGLTDRGVIDGGMRADLLVVKGNPLEDIAVLRKPIMVFKAGNKVAIEE